MDINDKTIKEAIDKVESRFPFENQYMSESYELYSNMAITINKYIKPGSKILDFGSGACDKTAVIQSLGYQCSGFDDLNDEWHRKDNNLNMILDFTKDMGVDLNLAENGYLPFDKESFDMVMTHDVYEHLHDSPREITNDLAELIKPGGYLFITVPNAVNIRKRLAVLRGETNLPGFASYYWYPGSWRGHIREYVKRDLSLLTEFIGFELVELRGCHHSLSVVPKKILPAYLVFTKVFKGWRDSWLLVAKKPHNWTPKREVSEHEFAEIMGRVSPYYRDKSSIQAEDNK